MHRTEDIASLVERNKKTQQRLAGFVSKLTCALGTGRDRTINNLFRPRRRSLRRLVVDDPVDIEEDTSSVTCVFSRFSCVLFAIGVNDFVAPSVIARARLGDSI